MSPRVATSISCFVLSVTSVTAIHLDFNASFHFSQFDYEKSYGEGCPIQVTPGECEDLAGKAAGGKFEYAMPATELTAVPPPPEGCYKTVQGNWYYNMGPQKGDCTPARTCVCRTDVKKDGSDWSTMPQQNFRARFPAAGDNDLFGPEDGLFTKDEWERAVGTAFGFDVLDRKIDQVPHGESLKAAIASPCPEIKNDKMEHPARSSWDSCGDKAYNRAMSVTNLEKVKVFIETLAMAKNGLVANPGKAFGGFCRNPGNIEQLDKLAASKRTKCTIDSNCNVAGEKCMPELVPPEKVSMYILDAILVQPLTRFTRSSLVGHIGGGRPDVFISHAWGGTFFHFLQSVLTHYYNTPGRKSKDKTYYWVCTFGVNQHMADIEVGAGIYGPFWGGIQLSKEVIAIQDDKVADIWFTLGRGWCVWEMMVTLMFEKPLHFVVPGGSMFNFNGITTSKTGLAADNMPHSALKRRLMGFAVTQAWAAPPEALADIRKEICEKACRFAKPILGGLTALDQDEKDFYLESWKDHDEDGMECFEDLFRIAGNLIEFSNAGDFGRKGRRNALETGNSIEEERRAAAVKGLSEKKRKKLERQLELTMPVAANSPQENDKMTDTMTQIGFIAPDSTGHCFQKNSECPEGPGKERSKPTTVREVKDFEQKLDMKDMKDSIEVGDSEGSDRGTSMLQTLGLMKEDDQEKTCESGRKKDKKFIRDSDFDSTDDKKEAKIDELREKLDENGKAKDARGKGSKADSTP